MKFGVFDYIEGGDAILARRYQDRIHLIQALEANGFYSYHLSEHHATPLSMTPSPFIFQSSSIQKFTGFGFSGWT